MRLPTTIAKKWPALVGVLLLLGLGSGIVVRRGLAVSPDPYLVLAPVGPVSQAQLGNEVARTSDVDGDGTPDFMSSMFVAASTDTGNTIAARVYSGSTGAILREIPRPDDTDSSYNSVAGLGDLDGDGFADFAVGTPGANLVDIIEIRARAGTSESGSMLERIGLVRVYSGQTGDLLWHRYGDVAEDFFGRSVSGVPDVNGDGVPDVLVGAHGHDFFEGPHSAPANNGGTLQNEFGRAYLLSGVQDYYSSSLCVLNGQAPGELFGMSVAGLGDVNGDGRGDFVVGAPMAAGEPGAGRVYLFAGYSQECELLHVWEGEQLGDTFGYAVASAGDVTGDGIPDVIVGAPGLARGRSDNQPGPGRAYVFSGSAADDYGLKHVFDGRAPNDLFGHDVAGGGFCDDDSTPDLIVGAPQHGSSKGFPGAAYVYSGKSGAQLRRFDGHDRTDLLGISVDWVGQLAGGAPPHELAIGVQGRDANGQLAVGSAQVISCEKIPRPEIEIDPSTLDLDTIAPGSTISATVPIRNVGDADLIVSATELISPSTSVDYSVAPGTSPPLTVAPGDTAPLTVVYGPATRGADVGLLHIASNDLDEPDVVIPLSGRAAAPDIAVAPTAIDFGADCRMGIEKSTVVTIRNEGNDNLVLTDLDFTAGSSSAFTLLDPPDLPYTLTDGAALNITVRFMPVNNLGDSGTLEITSNDPDEPTVSVSVVGQGKTNINPVARARYVPQEAPEPRTFHFNSDDSVDTDGSIVSYLWDFGDGATSTEADPLHTYAFDGTFIVTLTITDNDGDSDITSVAVEATATPVRSRFYGTVKIPGRRVIPDPIVERIEVSAWISGTLRAKTDVVVKQGKAVYAIRVPGTAADEGLEVTFRIEGLPVKQTGRWTSQSDTELNLTLKVPPVGRAPEEAQIVGERPRRSG